MAKNVKMVSTMPCDKEQRKQLMERLSMVEARIRGTRWSDKKAPPAIKAARKLLRKYEANESVRQERAWEAAKRTVSKTRDVVLFKSANQAVEAVKKLEAAHGIR